MKYIMYEKNNQKFPIIFPDNFVHSDINQAFHSLGMFKDFKPINAGQIILHEIDVHGKSETLNLVSDASDKLVIETYEYLFGL